LSGSRPTQNPWLTDHTIFASYRWLTWCVTGLWLATQGQIATYGAFLAGTLLLTLAFGMFARQYVQVARNWPALLSLDILLAVGLVLYSGGWESPFSFFAFGSLILPALLFGWPGGVMAGLTYVALSQAAFAARGTPAADRLFDGMLASVSVPIALVAPPIFAGLFALLIERIRQQARQRSNDHYPDRPIDFDPPVPRDSRSEPIRFPRLLRDDRRSETTAEQRIALQLTRTRTSEPNVEELRRVIFAPLPAPDMELGAIFDVLTTRFGQHTNLDARLSVIGRTRQVRPIFRDVLVRLAQEALLNIQQHANASTVTLTLRYDINSVALLIQDDGIGLADGSYQRPGLHTLRTMHYRIAEFGGGLEVFETEGGGVTVRAAMPLE
jgi:hypothetical protein